MQRHISSPCIFGIGELVWDLLPQGKRLGGAPANFAYWAAQLGGQASIVSGVGCDALGNEILQSLQSLGMSTALIHRASHVPTGTVSVTVTADGQPSYHIHEDVAWDVLPISDQLLAAMPQADAVCFGSLAQRTPQMRQAIQTLVRATPPSALRIFDVNLRGDFYDRETIASSLHLANVLKLNEHELPVMRDLLGFAGDELAILRAIAREYQLTLIALTKGEGGSLLLRGDDCFVHPGTPTTVVDTIGAGDAFTAAMTMGVLYGYPIPEVHDHASRLAAFVCSCAGATAHLPAELSLAPQPVPIS